MVILVQKVIECELVIVSEINDKKDTSVIRGKGYCRDEEFFVVYFTSGNGKYKYIVKEDEIEIYYNDSCYKFKNKMFSEGQIKNGDYIFKITTFASKIEIFDNLILIDYELSQNDKLIGKYYTKLSFN